jgi:hypothetical protein
MPISGNESVLTSALNSAIIAAIEAQYGGTIMDPEYINALSAGIANAIIPFLVSNTEVNVGQVVPPGTFTAPAGGGAITGASATSTPGTIS